MDPNAALEAILRGHAMLDHVEALRDWLLSGGFQPDPIWLPADCAPCFAHLPRETDIVATRHGLLVLRDGASADEVAPDFSWIELTSLAHESDAVSS